MSKIQLNGVSKTFKDVEIFENVSITFESGRIYGIVGPNGCGKSVLLQTICGLMKPTKGNIMVDELELNVDIDVLPQCGIIINKPSFFNDLDAFHNLKLLAKLRGTIDEEQILKTLKLVNLPNNSKKVGKFSLGMIQRLGIAQAIMENPTILILDEATNALDDAGIQMVHQILREEKEKGTLIIITSHHRYDIDELCDDVYSIQNGMLKYEER